MHAFETTRLFYAPGSTADPQKPVTADQVTVPCYELLPQLVAFVYACMR